RQPARPPPPGPLRVPQCASLQRRGASPRGEDPTMRADLIHELCLAETTVRLLLRLAREGPRLPGGLAGGMAAESRTLDEGLGGGHGRLQRTLKLAEDRPTWEGSPA